MREILFRGKDVVGNWYAGNLAVIKQDFHNGAGTIKAGSYISNECGKPFAYQVRQETVGQFTGITDKNGKKIFEGDIIEYPPQRKKFIVEFYNDCFGARDKKDKRTRIGSGDDFIIIGNIHDNPELLGAE